MLARLAGAGFAGLGLYPDQLRHPLGYAEPLRSLDDFDGAAIRLLPSEATDALVRALGGEPVYGLGGSDLDAAIASGEVDGTETSFGLALELAPPGSFLTGNVVWFPRVNALFATESTASSLSDAQWRILQEAASETFAFASESVPTSRHDRRVLLRRRPARRRRATRRRGARACGPPRLRGDRA